jgi:hypothetical protein
MKRLLALLLSVLLVLGLTACVYHVDPEQLVNDILDITESLDIETDYSQEDPQQTPQLDPNGTYDSKEDVALYIHLYGKLPNNYISKKEAEKLGWSGGSVEKYAPGKCIGGSYFGNYEGLLPEKDGRTWTECDIDTLGESGRGAKRIVFSNDGLIYYTDDHYESFELLYGEVE